VRTNHNEKITKPRTKLVDRLRFVAVFTIFSRLLILAVAGHRNHAGWHHFPETEPFQLTKIKEWPLVAEAVQGQCPLLAVDEGVVQ
jgi:hypothetical protein